MRFIVWKIRYRRLNFLSLTFEGSSPPTAKGERVAAALAAGCLVSAQNRNSLEFSLAWDMPKITFGAREKEHCRSVHFYDVFGF